MANREEKMKHLIRYNEAKTDDELVEKSQEIIDYLETFPDEYDNLEFKFEKIKVVIGTDGLHISVEYILPKILWKNPDDSVKDTDYIQNQILILERLKNLFKRLEYMGSNKVSYKEATFLSQRTRSIYVKVLIER
jgi:hypothetical protein